MLCLLIGIQQTAGVRAADLTPLKSWCSRSTPPPRCTTLRTSGYFKEAGLDVKITPALSSPGSIAAVISGAAEIANSSVAGAVAARMHGVAIRFFAPRSVYVSSEANTRVMVLKDSPIRNAADLSGKTVAVPALADLGYFATRSWAEQTAGDAANIKYIELPIPEMAGALARHRVDAATLVEPFITAAGGDLKSIATPNDFVAKRFFSTGWVASEASASTHADVADRFAAVMKKTSAWANAHHGESAESSCATRSCPRPG